MSEHDWLADADWPRTVTETNWSPGLPPPLEALQTRFRAEEGWEISYGTWVEHGKNGTRAIPVAIADHPIHGTTTFFPEPPKQAPAGHRFRLNSEADVTEGGCDG